MDERYWQARYESGQDGWDRGAVHPALLNWLESGQLKRCRIVIPGCGRGYEAVELAKRGFAVTAIDFAAGPLRELGCRLEKETLSCDLVRDDIFSYRPGQAFDAIYEQTCLCAIEPERRRDYVDAIGRWLKPGGKFFGLLMQRKSEGGPPFHCDLDEMKSIFGAAWEWDLSSSQRYRHPSGGVQEVSVAITYQPQSSLPA